MIKSKSARKTPSKMQGQRAVHGLAWVLAGKSTISGFTVAYLLLD